MPSISSITVCIQVLILQSVQKEVLEKQILLLESWKLLEKFPSNLVNRVTYLQQIWFLSDKT